MSNNLTENDIAQHTFNLQLSANYACRDDGKKETIDSLLAG